MSEVWCVWVARRALVVRALAAVLGAGTFSFGVPDASAESAKAVADRLFEEGKTLLSAGDWTGACAKFQASFDADPAVSTSVKIARCREHEGKLERAVAEYRRALELNHTLPQTAERKKELEALIRSDLAALEPRVPKLRFEITPRPSGLEVSVNGALVAEAALAGPIAVDPGDADVVVRAPGYREERLRPRVPEGVTHEVVLRLVPVANTPAPTPPPSPAPVAAPAAPAPSPASRPAPPPVDALPDDAGSGQKTFGAVVGGAGVLALGVAGYFGIKTLVLVNAARPRCPDDECDSKGYRWMNEAETSQTVGFIVGAGGALLVGAGVALYFTAPEPGAAANQGSLAARLGPGGASLEGTF